MKLRLEFTATRGGILTKTGSRDQIGIYGFPRNQITDGTKNLEYRQGVAVSRVSNKIPRVPTSSYAGEIPSLFYGFGMEGMLKGILSDFLFGKRSGDTDICPKR